MTTTMFAAERKAENDPWTPMPEDTKGIAQPPANPLYQLIDSGRYIDSLEKRLQRIQGKNKKDPSSRDIISSLACLRDDQMLRFMDKEDSVFSTISIMDSDSAGSSSASYLQRRLHPERQAINMEELFELLKDDELDRHRPLNDSEQDGHDPQHEDEVDRQKSEGGDDAETHTTPQEHQDR